jgi:hypothetical protein
MENNESKNMEPIEKKRSFGHINHNLECKSQFSDRNLSLSWHDPGLTQSFIDLQKENIKEHHRTQRLALVLSTLLVIIGGTLLVLAPHEKQILANWIGIVMFVFSVGVFGYANIKLKFGSSDINLKQNIEKVCKQSKKD